MTTTQTVRNTINWFEIPSRNLDAAIPFYERTLGIALKREVFGGIPHAVFPVDQAEHAIRRSGSSISIRIGSLSTERLITRW